MGQKDGVLDAGIPGRGRECEFCLPIAAFRNRRELKEVSGDDELNTPERTAIVSYTSGDLFKLVEEVSVDHRHLINNQDFCA